MRRSFIIYIIAISLFAFGFLDFPLITMHAAKMGAIDEAYLPLLYSGAMIVDAFAALFFGWLYDKYGIATLAISTLVGAPFAWLVFGTSSSTLLIVGTALWGVAMGAQESTMKAAVSSILPKSNRAAGYGVFETMFGVAWFLGSALLGWCYDQSIETMIIISTTAQLTAVPFFVYLGKQS